MTDQQRFDSLGCYGAGWVRTPNLDRLAAAGTVFDNCYVDNPICTPSRASLLTGKPVPGHGVYRLNDILPADQRLVPSYLKDLGYRTALFGKLHVSSRACEARRRRADDGFDVYEWCIAPYVDLDSPMNAYARWLAARDAEFFARQKREGKRIGPVPYQYHMTHWAAERTIGFIQSWDGRAPFFCMMSITDPHDPYDDFPSEMLARVDEALLPEPTGANECSSWPSAVRREQRHSYLGSAESKSKEELRRMRAGYFASIALIDQEIGRVLDALEEKGLAENTLVVFASDHGDMLGDHGLLAKGAFFYEPSVKVPLIVRWPAGGVASKRTPDLVQLSDLAATFLRTAGAEPEKVDAAMPHSRDLSPVCRGEEGIVRDAVVCCYRNSGMSGEGGFDYLRGRGAQYWDPPINATMIRAGRYKMNLYHGDPGGRTATEGQLFDMESDPRELNDLWASPPAMDVRAQLLEKLAGWLFSQERYHASRGGHETP
jgi:arylsulfatase A-like enzyme